MLSVMSVDKLKCHTWIFSKKYPPRNTKNSEVIIRTVTSTPNPRSVWPISDSRTRRASTPYVSGSILEMKESQSGNPCKVKSAPERKNIG